MSDPDTSSKPLGGLQLQIEKRNVMEPGRTPCMTGCKCAAKRAAAAAPDLGEAAERAFTEARPAEVPPAFGGD